MGDHGVDHCKHLLLRAHVQVIYLVRYVDELYKGLVLFLPAVRLDLFLLDLEELIALLVSAVLAFGLEQDIL